MAGLPEITMAGTLTADPELKFLPSGIAVANFTVATNDRRFDKTSNEWVDGSATFLRCTIWRQAAEHVGESLSKGTRVLLTGTLRQREWTTEDGQKRYAFEVDVTEIGPSLKWATTKVNKATRANGTDRGSWGDTPPPAEPPF